MTLPPMWVPLCPPLRGFFSVKASLTEKLYHESAELSTLAAQIALRAVRGRGTDLEAVLLPDRRKSGINSLFIGKTRFGLIYEV